MHNMHRHTPFLDGSFGRNDGLSLCISSVAHSPARGLCELHIGWGLTEPLIHSQHGAIVSMVETLIKSHVFFHKEMNSRIAL